MYRIKQSLNIQVKLIGFLVFFTLFLLSNGQFMAYVSAKPYGA